MFLQCHRCMQFLQTAVSSAIVASCCDDSSVAQVTQFHCNFVFQAISLWYYNKVEVIGHNVTVSLHILSPEQSIELCGMGFQAEQLQPRHTSPGVTQSVGCCGVRLSTSGIWSSRDMLSGVANPSPPANLTDESGFGGCQDNCTCLTVLYKVWCRGDYGVGLFRSWAWPLCSS